MAGVGRERMGKEGEERERKWPPSCSTDKEVPSSTDEPCRGELPRRKAGACYAH